MPRSKPKWRPGIDKTNTFLANEGGYSDGNLVRFYQGFPQPVGGWQADGTFFAGKARGAHAWTNLDGQRCVAWGTAERLYGRVEGARRDITPLLHFTVLTNAFTTLNGSPIVRVDVPFHNLSDGDSVVFSNHQTTVGGLTIEGTFTVTEVLNTGAFTITAGSNASSTVAAGGGNVDFSAALPAGLEFNDPAGYGRGTYGSGPYGSAGATSTMRVWNLANFGENLMANPSGYGLAEWQPEGTYLDLAFNGTFTGNANGWALGTGWAYASNAVTKTAGVAANLSQSILGVLEGGRTYVITFTVTRAAGSLKFRINAGAPPAVIDVSTASAAITKSGTYTRIFRCPADPSDIVFEADSSFGGTVDSVSYQLYEKAYFIPTAPAVIDAMAVSPKGVVIAAGCVTTEGVYDPNAVRNCAVGNNRDWIPDTGNVASEIVLRGGGGRLLAVVATRQQELVWGDDGVFSLQWAGEPGGAYIPQLLATSCGLLSRHSFATANGFVLWASNTRDFYIFRGIGATSLGIPEKIPCPVREDVFDNFNFGQDLACCGGLVPGFSEFWLFYPDTRDGTDENSRAVAFNWIDGVWMTHVISRTAWIPSGVLENPIGFGTLNGQGIAYTHETGTTANGALLGAWLQTSDVDIEDGDRLGTVKAIWPDAAKMSGTINLTVYARSASFGQTITHGPYVMTSATPRIPTRIMGRQLSVRFDWATPGGFGRLGSIPFTLDPVGARRQ
jgi:hypothetical protein